MSQPIHLSIDAMGGDQGSRLVVQATFAYLKAHSDVTVTLVGDRDVIQPLLESQNVDKALRSRVALLHAEETVDMADKASDVLRTKKTSSMWQAVNLVAEEKADACVSGGNTGAFMAIGCKLVKTFDGIRRPAICKRIPTSQGYSVLLDLGANINCSAEQLVQFAVMGAALAELGGIKAPSVALLNIGTERSKGGEEIQLAAQALNKRGDIKYAGFVEGHNLYSGEFNVIVCDGLIGNVALKVSEGAVNFVLSSLAQTFKRSVWHSLIGWLAKPVLRNWRRLFTTSRYNGAALLGLRRTLVKSHGGADQLGFEQALDTAVQQVRQRIPQRIESSLSEKVSPN